MDESTTGEEVNSLARSSGTLWPGNDSLQESPGTRDTKSSDPTAGP
jgi:hypothetical protein